MSISAGTYTVGGSGTNYPGVTGLDDAIADEAAFTGALTYVVSGPVNWTADVNINQNGYARRITSDTPHYGAISAGWYVSVDTDVLLASNVAHITVDNLKFNPIGAGGTINLGNGFFEPYYTFDNCIFNNVALNYGSPSSNNESKFTNNIHYYTGIQIYAWDSVDTPITIENNFFYSTQISIVLRNNSTNGELEKIILRNNNIFRDAGAAISIVAGTYKSYPEGYNNATKDTNITDLTWSVSSDNVPNADPAGNIQSLDITSDLYGNLIDGTRIGATYTPGAADIGQAGMLPTYAGATDAAGNTRPDEGGFYPIGPFSQQYVFGGHDVKMIQDKIVITHSRHNEFSFGLNFTLDE